jgi:hypothetical protein
MIPGQSPKLTDRSYISEQMFDRVVREKFQSTRTTMPFAIRPSS